MNGIAVHWRGLCLQIREVLQQRWQQNSIFILKTVSTETVWQELHKSNIHVTAAIAKPLITDNSTKRWKRSCDDHKTWPSDDWKHIKWSGESSFTLFTTLGRVCVWTSPKEAYNPECLVPTVKHGARSVMISAPISSILLVLYLLWMVELLPVATWTFYVAGCILWSRCCFLTIMRFFKMVIRP